MTSSPKNEETLPPPVLVLEQPKPKNEGIPGWAKAAIIGVGAVAGILVVGNVVYGTLTAPINTYKDLLNKQYSDFLKKIDGYTKSSPSGFTAAQQQSIGYETTIMNQTAQGLANTSKSLTDLGAMAINDFYTLAIALGGTFIGLYATAKYVIPALKSRLGAPISTASGSNNAIITVFADYFAANGYPVQATNIMASGREIFATYDQPVMQQSINSLNAILPTLSGVELYLAQLQIESFTMEMAIIPQWLALPLPL